MKQILISVSIVLFFTQIALSQTKVTLANNTSKTIYACYGKYENTDNGITTRGYYKIEPYQELELHFGDYAGTLYFFARGTDTDTEGQIKLCIGDKAFKVLNADKIHCEHEGMFKALKVRYGQEYKFIFNPSAR